MALLTFIPVSALNFSHVTVTPAWFNKSKRPPLNHVFVRMYNRGAHASGEYMNCFVKRKQNTIMQNTSFKLTVKKLIMGKFTDQVYKLISDR